MNCEGGVFENVLNGASGEAGAEAGRGKPPPAEASRSSETATARERP